MATYNIQIVLCL
jgi:hypothetical protein